METEKFLPMTREEMDKLGWPQLDILLVTGDAYIDHHSFGVAIIGRVLLSHGYKVGIIAQPDWNDPKAFEVMGRPRFFCGVTAGNLDSILAHYTAAKKIRHDDAYTPGGRAGMRPNFPTIVYTQMLKRVFPGITVALGGIEASLRRCVHYDFWEDKIKPTILLPSKADVLMFGMGEKSILEIAEACANGSYDFSNIRGTARLLGKNDTELLNQDEYVKLPSYESCQKVRSALFDMTKMIEKEMNPYCGKPLLQMHGDRALIVNPPQFPLTTEEMDKVYNLPFTRLPHPSYKEEIPAWNMVKDSITILRGCAGGCSFCSLSFHQGKFITSRSKESILKEVKEMLANCKKHSGTITDLGGPTANLYGCKNGITKHCKGCRRPSCLYPEPCKNFKLSASEAIDLYRAVRKTEGVKHVFINSGIRMDVAIKFPNYIKELVKYHVSGHLKVAPEHLHRNVLNRMRKPDPETFYKFMQIFEDACKETNKEQYIVPYFMSGFPGCTENEMQVVSNFLSKRRWNLQQVQSFIPLPMTAAAAMYYSNIDYNTEKSMHVIKSKKLRAESKELLVNAVEEIKEERRKTSGRPVKIEKNKRFGKPDNRFEKDTKFEKHSKKGGFHSSRQEQGRNSRFSANSKPNQGRNSRFSANSKQGQGRNSRLKKH